METKQIIYELRTKQGLSQDELAEKVYVTRQAVSRWENGDTIPNTETLKLLSKIFDVLPDKKRHPPDGAYFLQPHSPASPFGAVSCSSRASARCRPLSLRR